MGDIRVNGDVNIEQGFEDDELESGEVRKGWDILGLPVGGGDAEGTEVLKCVYYAVSCRAGTPACQRCYVWAGAQERHRLVMRGMVCEA